MYIKSCEGEEKKSLVKASKLILCSREKVLVLIWDSEIFVFTGDGFSFISGLTEILCSPENPPLLLIIKLYRRVFVFTGVDSVENRIIIAKERRRSE